MKFVLLIFLATNAKQDPFFHLEKNVPISIVMFGISAATTKGLGPGRREVAGGPFRVTWPSVSSCQPSVSLELIDLSLTESLRKQRSRDTPHTCCRTLTRTELKMITSGTYRTTWKWCSVKEKIIWGHRAWNEHLTRRLWTGFRKLL